MQSYKFVKYSFLPINSTRDLNLSKEAAKTTRSDMKKKQSGTSHLTETMMTMLLELGKNMLKQSSSSSKALEGNNDPYVP